MVVKRRNRMGFCKKKSKDCKMYKTASEIDFLVSSVDAENLTSRWRRNGIVFYLLILTSLRLLVAVFVILAMVLRRKPEALINVVSVCLFSLPGLLLILLVWGGAYICLNLSAYIFFRFGHWKESGWPSFSFHRNRTLLALTTKKP